jgi:SAM-dependent methyltransferase
VTAAAPVFKAIYEISRFAALATMAELGVADQLGDGALEVNELARRCGAHAPSLRRVLRELAGMGYVQTTGFNSYQLTELGRLLRSDVPDSVRAAVRTVAHEAFWFALGSLPQTVRTGRSAMAERFGPPYEYLAAHPHVAAMFDEYMALRAAPFAGAVAASYDFSGVRRVVDVGGGKGHILSGVLRAFPHLEGELFDLERVVPAGRAALEAAGLADRCTVTVGDFFAEVPPGADAYLLANVLHNWNDDDATTILRNVRDAMAPGGRALILEIVLPDDDVPHVGKDGDMRMLALTGEGMERTESEYVSLLERSGLRLNRIIELPAWANLIEATARLSTA